jgi:hypothetical protein
VTTKGPLPPIRREAPEDIKRGLSAVRASKEDRNKIKRPAWRAVVWFGLTLTVALIAWFKYDSNRNESLRAEILSKHRAVEATLGPKWYPVRDQVESWTIELAKSPVNDEIDRAALANFKFQDMAGIYLRVGVDQAKDVPTLREAVSGSFKDAFTACLMRTPAESGTDGKDCAISRECASGEVCNEYQHCAKPSQPFNLRLAYRSLFVLEPEWVKNVEKADSNLVLRGYSLAFDDANYTEFPIATEILTLAKFFLVVVDDRPIEHAAKAVGDAPSAADVDFAAGRAFPSRIGLFRLEDKKPLVKMTRVPSFELKGGAPVSDVGVLASRNRQAQSCALALEVRKAIGDVEAR